MHFAAGVVVAVLAVELLPEVQLMRGGIVHVVGGFVLGTLAMLGLMAWSQRAGEAKRSFPLGIVAAAAVDVTIDGLTIGTGFVAAPATGRLLAIGLATELFPLGLSVAGALRGVSRGRSALTVFALAVLPGIAAVLAGAISAALRRGFWS